MKKYIAIMLAMTAVVAVTFSSCKPDEEIYNPRCKISKIWYRSDVGDPDETYHYDKKGILESIDIDSAESYQFTYNKDKTVSKIVHVGEDYTETITMAYTRRLVHKIVYAVNDTVRQEITFTRDKETDRIASSTETYDVAFFHQYSFMNKYRLYSTFMGNIGEMSRLVSAPTTKGLTVRCEKTFVYYPGKNKKYENLQQVVEKYPDSQEEITRTYTYDTETYNPFYGLPYAYTGYAGYYLNNKLTERVDIKTRGINTRTTIITYNYSGAHYLNDKKYPRQFVSTSSENNIPIHTYILYVK